MRVTAPILRALPLTALFALAAVTVGCNIVIGGNNNNSEGEGEGPECTDLGAICPSLSCENGNVLDADGCAICECNTNAACDLDVVGAAPECANAFLDPQTCQWNCNGGPECFADVDCGRGSVCVLTDCADGGAPPEDGSGDIIGCGGGAGFCQQIATECFSDFDCGQGSHCEFNDQPVDGGGVPPDGGDNADPPPPDGGGGAERPVPAPSGQCVADEVVPCFFGEGECGEGRHCEAVDGNADNLVVAGGICVDDAPVSECSSDAECAEGDTCFITCLADPNCPNCDICLIFGKCITPQVPCSSDLECGPTQVCSFDGGAAERPAPCDDLDNNGECDAIAPPPPPQGVCIDVIIDSGCASDAECAEGEVCKTEQTDCVCTAECRDDGMGGCLPCECPTQGTCVPAGGCGIDADCAPGQACQLPDTDSCVCTRECIPDDVGGCLPCDCPTQGTCVDVIAPECSDAAPCAPGQVCEFGPEGCDVPACETVDGQQVCHPCDPILVGRCVEPTATTCFSDGDCLADETCVFDGAFAPPPPECTDPAACAPPAEQGTCQPSANNDPCALVRCMSGQCVVGADGTATCVEPAPGADCASNTDCASGETCNAGGEVGQVCNRNPSCAPDAICTAECWGTCSAPTTP